MSGFSWGSSNNNNSSGSGFSWGSSNNNNNNNNSSNNNNNNNNSGWSWGSNNSSNNNNNSNNNSSGSSWNFGSNNNNSNSTNNNNNSSSFSWGSTNNSNSSNSSGGFNWGSNNNSSSGGFNWGSTTSSNNNNNNNNNSSGSSWNFSSNNNSNNSNTNNNNNTSWNFGNSSNNNNNNYFGSNNSNNSNSNQYNPQNPRDVMKRLYNEYDPNSNNCRFEVILYNRKPPNCVINLQKPVNVRPQLWDKFVADNPDKEHLIPAALRGYNQLDIRGKQCLSGHSKLIKHYGIIAERVEMLKMDIEKRIKDQILELKQVQRDLSYRLLVVVKAYILCSLKAQREQQGQVISSPLTVSERTMRDTLEGMAQMTRELQYKMANVDRMLVAAGTEGMAARERAVEEKVTFDGQQMKAMFNCLSDDTKIIALLAKTVQKDYEDLEIMRRGLDRKSDLFGIL